MNYLILILSWGAYLTFHSLLAANPMKSFFEEKMGMGRQGYRLFYVAISGVGILALLFLMAVMESKVIFQTNQAIQYVGMVIAVWGVILIVASFRKLSGLAFLGFKKENHHELVTEGIHGKIRHPIYAGTILIFLGMFLYTPTDVVLVSVLVVYAYLPAGIYFEEKKLVQEFGEDYRIYRRSVPALIPRLF